MSAFADRVERQIFSPSTPLEIIAGCLGFVREQAVKTQEQGLDITYMLDNRFRRNIERTVSSAECVSPSSRPSVCRPRICRGNFSR